MYSPSEFGLVHDVVHVVPVVVVGTVFHSGPGGSRSTTAMAVGIQVLVPFSSAIATA